ncbi:SigE family RNA polymerase sigma factor [Flindersiella endophytica]
MEPDNSFREFVDARGATLSRAAYLLAGEQTVARDLLRGALAKALKQWDRLRDGGDPDDFVRQTMLSATWLWWRHPRRPGEFATAVLPDHPVEDAEAPDILPNAVLAAILPRLRRRQRVVLYLRFGEDVPVPETARLLSSSSDKVATYTRSAIRRCRELAPGVLPVPDHDEPDMWPEYRRFADSITSFAAADDAMVAIGRNRRVGAAIAAVPLVLILVVVAGALLDGGFRSPGDSTGGELRAFGPVRQLPSPDPTPLVPIDVWRRPENEPVPTGTLIEGERSGCGYYDGCHLYLRTREGVRISVESLLPGLSRRWTPIGLHGATWSPNGVWFGLARSQTYEFHNFSNGDLVRLPTGPSQSFWEPIGWSADSSEAYLIRVEDDRLAEYFVFDAERGGYRSFRPDNDFTLRPVGVGRGGSLLVADPIKGTAPPTGKFKVWSLDIKNYADQPPGSLIGTPFTLDVSKHLRKGETIIGPSGVPKVIRPVLGDNARAWVTVFKEERSLVVPVAVLHLANDDTQTARIELPRDEQEGNWRLLGALGSGIAMLHEPLQGDSEIVLFNGLGRQSVQYVPESSDVLLPGMSY